MKIVLLQLHQLENAISALAIVKQIKFQHKEAVIHIVTTTALEWFWSRVEEVEKIWLHTGDATPVVINLLKEKFSHSIDAEATRRSSFISFNLGQQYNSILQKIRGKNRWAALLSNTTSGINPIQILQQSKDLNLASNQVSFSFPEKEEDALHKDDIPMSHSAGYYILEVLPNTSLEMMQNVMNTIQFPIILLGEKDVFDKAESIKNIDQFKVYNACGKYTITEQFQLLKYSSLNIISSKSLQAMAAAAHKKLIVGNTELPFISSLEYYNNAAHYSVQSLNNVAALSNAIAAMLKK
jgi:ADP-heptose:LPS heptosyltransferase